MGQLDNALRGQAIPFLGQIAGYNRSDQSDLDITVADALGDLFNMSNTNAPYNVPAQNNLIRILRPQFMQVVAAYLTISLNTANAETSPKFYLTVGTGYTSNPKGLIPAIPTTAQIIANHTLIKGDANPWTTANGLAGTITVNKANILAALPKITDTNYRDDCFVVGIHFLQTPLNTAGYKFIKLEANMSGIIQHNG